MTATREKRVRQVRALRAKGLSHAEIGRVLGISRSYSSDLDTDPDRTRTLARRSRYGRCGTCGRNTDGSNGRKGAPQNCATCIAELHLNKVWTRDAIIIAVWQWASEHGRPPTVTDWMPAGSYWPAATATYGPSEEFATWADVIEAAGFPRPITGKSSGDVRPNVNRALIDVLNERGRLTLEEGKVIVADLRPHLPAHRWGASVHNTFAWACRLGYAVRVPGVRPALWTATYIPRRRAGRRKSVRIEA